MVCNQCERKIYEKTYSTCFCQRCGKSIKITHSGGYKYCFKCSNSLGVCQQCGKPAVHKKEVVEKNPFCKICDCNECLYKRNCVFGDRCKVCENGKRVKNCPIKNGEDF